MELTRNSFKLRLYIVYWQWLVGHEQMTVCKLCNKYPYVKSVETKNLRNARTFICIHVQLFMFQTSLQLPQSTKINHIIYNI